MRKVSGVLLLGLALNAVLIGCAGGTAAALPGARAGEALTGGAGSATTIPWLPEYDAGLEQARAENKEILLYFHAIWCTFCKTMDTEVFSTPEVSHIIVEHFIPIKVDIDQRANSMLVAKYMVRGTPTFVVLNHNEEILVGKGGKPSGYFVGAMSEPDFLAFLNAFAAK